MKPQTETQSVSPLTPEQKRVKIAEACGWTARPLADQPPDDPFTVLVKPCGEETGSATPGVAGLEWFTCRLPDYLGDLNAIHEAEATLTDTPRWEHYERALRKITLEEGRDGGGLYERLIRATASQRADAFLLTINHPEK